MSAQKEFEDTYISATQVQQYMGVSRPAIFYRKKNGLLPGEIKIPGVNVSLWKRAEIMPILDAWKQQMKERKAGYNT